MAQCAACGSENPEAASFCRQCGGELPRVDPLLGAEVLGRYKVIRLIGEGGMGRIYEAEQRVGTTTRRVAIKTLRPQLGADPQLARRFFREAETIVRLSHPNLIQFFDFGELTEIQPGMLAIVMEFIEGRSLAQEAAQGPMDAARVDHILAQICGALAEAHGLGIVHRDLKPDNILLTRRGGHDDFVKVLDFGIAKLSAAEDERSTKLTQQGMMVGTPPYMSPEQFSGEAIDARSDIYSLGVIAYEMLTGRLPFDARTPWEWASKHLTAEPTPLRNAAPAPGVSERRSAAIVHALAKRPEQRPQTVGAFLAEFVEEGALPVPFRTGSSPAPIVTGSQAQPVKAQGTPPHPESLQQPLPRLTTTTRPLLGLAAGGLVAAIALGAWLSSREQLAPPPPVPAVLQAPPAPLVPSAPVAAAPTPDQPGSASPAEGPPSSQRGAKEIAATSRRTRERGHDDREPAHGDRQARVAGADDDPQPPAAAGRSAPAGGSTSIVGANELAAAPGPRTLTTVPHPPATAGLPAPAAADLQSRVEKAMALAPQRPEVAIGLYQAAAARYGANQPALAPLRNAIAKGGETRIREWIAGGRCAQAQALFRALRGIAAESAAQRSFGSGCPVP